MSLVGDVFVQADVELAFVQLPHRLAHVVVAQGGIVGVGQRIQVDQLLADRVDQALRNLVAGRARRLASVRGRGKRVARAIAHERNRNRVRIRSLSRIGIDQADGVRLAEGIVAEIAVSLATDGTKPVKGIPCR